MTNYADMASILEAAAARKRRASMQEWLPPLVVVPLVLLLLRAGGLVELRPPSTVWPSLSSSSTANSSTILAGVLTEQAAGTAAAAQEAGSAGGWRVPAAGPAAAQVEGTAGPECTCGDGSSATAATAGGGAAAAAGTAVAAGAGGEAAAGGAAAAGAAAIPGTGAAAAAAGEAAAAAAALPATQQAATTPGLLSLGRQLPRLAPPAGDWRGWPLVGNTSYRSALPRRQLDKGLLSFGERSRSRRAVHKLLTGRPFSMAFLGGSITWHDNSTAGMVWLTHRWLQEAFPASQVTVHNGGLYAVPSSYFALCSYRHAPADVDLVIVDLAVNDGNAVGDAPLRRTHERLVRKLLSYPNAPAVVELTQWAFPRDWNAEAVPFRARNAAGHDEVGLLAQYYDLPWLSWRKLYKDYIKHIRPYNRLPQDPSISVPAWAPADLTARVRSGGWAPQETYKDLVHPNDRGHRLMADLVIHFLQRTLDDVAREPLEKEDEWEARRPLPEPMFRGNYHAPNNTCLLGEDFRLLVSHHDPAFQWRDEGTAGKPKLGFVSTLPGSSLQITVDTNVVQHKNQEKATLAIAYLCSYEHMGKFEVQCISGCQCERVTIDGHYDEKNSQMHMVPLTVTTADVCVIKATVLDATRSGEHKVKIMGVVVGEVPGMLFQVPRSSNGQDIVFSQLAKTGRA